MFFASTMVVIVFFFSHLKLFSILFLFFTFSISFIFDSFLIYTTTTTLSYDLDIVHHDEINPNDYFTLSYSGITHFMNDPSMKQGNATSSSEFTQLDQFEREHYLFSQICKLKFFQQFWM